MGILEVDRYVEYRVEINFCPSNITARKSLSRWLVAVCYSTQLGPRSEVAGLFLQQIQSFLGYFFLLHNMK